MKKAKLEKYRRSWQKRREKNKKSLVQRNREARELAQKCGKHLRKEYGVAFVYLVGSTVFSSRFHPRSDIDLLVKGLPDEKYFTALKECWDLLRPGFELDLIPWEDAPEKLKEKAREQGELL